jgi:hypothetical protein
MAYQNLNRPELQKLLRERFLRKKEDLKERGWKFAGQGVTNELLIGYLRQLDEQPVKLNKYQELQAEAKALNIRANQKKEELERQVVQEKARRAEAERLQRAEQRRLREARIDQFKNDPVNTFNRYARTPHNFTDEELNAMFSSFDGHYIISMKSDRGKEIIITLTPNNLQKLKEVIKTKLYSTEYAETYASDSLLEIVDEPIREMEIEKLQNKRSTEVHKNSAFFNYLNQTDIDLTRFQIYNKDNKEDNTSCLVHVLKESGIEESLLQELILQLGSQQTSFPLSKMNEVATLIKRNITIHYYDEKTERMRDNLKYKSSPEHPTLEIAHFKNHFFLYEKTKYTKFYIENKLELDESTTHEKRFSYTRKYNSTNPTFLMSLHLVVKMFQLNMFSDYTTKNNVFVSDNYIVEPSLNNMEINQDEFKFEGSSKDKEDDSLHLFADCEADVVSGDKHELIAFGFSCHGEYHSYHFMDTMSELVEKIKSGISRVCQRHGVKVVNKDQNKKVIVWFHNLKYDSFLLQNLLYSNAECVKDGQVYSKQFYMNYGIKVEFRDSYKHFGGKLSQAPETFNLSTRKKEAIGYTYHTKFNMRSHACKVDEYMKHIRPEDRHLLRENIGEDFKYNKEDDTFDASEYYLYYLKYDVLVLQEAMNAYRKLIKQITNLDAFNFLTISSIAHHYVKSNGAYDGLYHTRGCLREFIQKSIKGGRVYVNPEFQCKIINDRVEDFDAVSLYPSAMKRLCEEFGLPIGKISRGTNNSYEYYEGKTWYIVKIMLKSIRKTQHIPCISVKTHDGLMKYINHVEEPTTLYVDKTTLNDYITFHDIEFDIIEGIYWDNGFNKKLGDLIINLHNERCKYKKTNKPLATVIKLIMNSIYGKTGQKSSDSKIIFKPIDNYKQYIYDHFSTIRSIEPNTFNVKITKQSYDNSYSLNFVASSILSMSKRLMNEVFSVMNDEKMPVYYTDTDSIHMLQKDVLQLGKKYSEAHGRELIGKNLGQFHTDFEMEGCKDVVSVKHIPIQPKMYLDVLQGVDEKTLEVKHDTHVRIKGITQAGIKNQIETIMKKERLNEIDATIELFERIREGKRVKFIMNPTEFNVSFEFDKDGIATRKTREFVRVVKYGSEDPELDVDHF